MKRIISISLGSPQRDYQTTLTWHNADLSLQRMGTDGDPHQAAALIQQYRGQADAISLEMGGYMLYPSQIHRLLPHNVNAKTMPPIFVFDGSALKATLERWAIKRIADQHPDLFPKRRILIISGQDRPHIAQALAGYAPHKRFADPLLHCPLLPLPTPRSLTHLRWYTMTLAPIAALIQRYTRTQRVTYRQGEVAANSLPPVVGEGQGIGADASPHPRMQRLIAWAEVIIGDYDTLHRYLPTDLTKKTIITDNPTRAEIADLQVRQLQTLITFAPVFSPDSPDSPDSPKYPHFSTATLEAMIAVTYAGENPLEESRLLHILATGQWHPTVYPLTPAAPKPCFAFVVHPLTTKQIALHPDFRFTRYLPQRLVEWAAAYMPPLYISRIRGIRSQATGKEIQGVMLALTSTPREMLHRPPAFTYKRLLKAARMAELRGAKIMGLGAFTSIVGDAGVTVAQQSPIGITSGNSLTVAATLESAKWAAKRMGKPIDQGCALILGATGSIGAACARLLAMTLHDVILIAPRPERLLALKMQIAQETPHAHVTIATRPDPHLSRADLIITTTSALQGRVLDIERLKPGAIICDVARPPNVLQEEADRRPDVLVIESGEIILPGTPDFGFDLDLPPGTAYACLAETALLAMDGRTENYTIGRSIGTEQVKEMYRLMRKHGLQLAELRSFGKPVTDADIAEKRRLAGELYGSKIR